MKVIFLDHDGVICLQSNWGTRFTKQKKFYKGKVRPSYAQIPFELKFDNFDKKAIDTLNSILLETGAEIVVSSDWRFHMTLEQMGEYYTQQGIIKKPIAFTKNTLRGNHKFYNPKTDLEETRSAEILNWLSENKVDSWVAIDDLDMSVRNNSEGYMWGLTNFVHTKRSNEGIKQTGIKEKILNFLT